MSNYQRKPNYKCVICNTDMYVRPSAMKASKGWGFTCSKECGKQNRSKHTSGIANHQYGIKGEQNASFTGHEKINQYGYKLIYKPDHPRANHAGYCYEHNLVMEKHLGRALKFIHHKHPDNEVCHHIDRDKLNNSIDNLQLMTEKTHFELHKKEDDYAIAAGATKASFTKQEALAIKKEYENTNITQNDLAKKYNTCQGVISSVILEKRKCYEQ